MSGRGKRLESLVRKAARSLADRQIARIYRWPEAKATKMIPQRCACGRMETTLTVVHTEAPGADFWGFTVGGRVIMIECKETDRPSLPLGDNGLKTHQAIALLEAHRADGIALLVWYRKKEIAVIDMDIVRRLSKGRKSVPWKDIPSEFIHPEEDVEGLFTPYLQAQPA